MKSRITAAWHGVSDTAPAPISPFALVCDPPVCGKASLKVFVTCQSSSPRLAMLAEPCLHHNNSRSCLLIGGFMGREILRLMN